MELYTAGFLENGMGFLIAPRPGAHLVHLSLYLDQGVKDEHSAENGISHLLEHVLFNPNHLTGKQKTRWDVLARNGARFEAWTGKEHTRIGLSCLPRDLPGAMTFASELLREAKISKTTLEHERKIVLDEIQRKRSRPEFLWTLVEEALYAPPYGMSILGRSDVVNSLSLAQLRKRAAQTCVPERTRLVVAGKVDATTARLVEDTFAGWEGTGAQPDEAPLEIVPRIIGVNGSGERVTLYLSFPAPALGDGDRPAAEIMSSLLGGGLRSRLFRRLREERGLAYAVSGGSSHWRRSGYVFVAADLAKNKLAEGFSCLLESFAELNDTPPDEEEIYEVRESYALRVLQESEGPGLASRLALHWMNDEVYYPSRAFSLYRRVRPHDVRVAAGILDVHKMAMVGIGASEDELASLLEVTA